MITVKFSKRELTDLLHALEYALDDYAECAKHSVTDEERALYERRDQRASALYHKLSAAQEKAQ